MDNVGKVWFIIVLSIVLIRAAFAIAKKQVINPIGLLMGGYFGAIGGTAIGGIIGALLSRTTFNMMALVNQGLNIDIYQVTIYGGIGGAIIGTIGGATVGAIGGGSRPKGSEGLPKSVFIWLVNIALGLASLMIGIGFSIVLGKHGGLAMYGALSAAMQWRILGGKQWGVLGGRIGTDDIGYSISMLAGFTVWVIMAMLVQSLGGIVIGTIGGTIVGVGQWLVIEKEWLIIEKKSRLSIQEWILICAVLGGILGSIIELFTEYIIL